MKKKIITLITLMTILTTITACDSCLNKETIKTPNEQSTENNETNSSIGATTKVDKNEENYSYDSTMKIYTNETLPEDQQKNDFDGDGIKNSEEIELNTNMYKMDTDEDGISDYDEIKNTKTNPTKWSSRNDEISDLEWIIINKDFKEGYVSTKISDFVVYIQNAKDQMWICSKATTNAFNDLETISEAYQIKNFSGKMALNCSRYDESVANVISIYVIKDNKATKVETSIENNMVVFEVEENDIFVAVYEEK